VIRGSDPEPVSDRVRTVDCHFADGVDDQLSVPFVDVGVGRRALPIGAEAIEQGGRGRVRVVRMRPRARRVARERADVV
jgi:hypothetical protein